MLLLEQCSAVGGGYFDRTFLVPFSLIWCHTLSLDIFWVGTFIPASPSQHTHMIACNCLSLYVFSLTERLKHSAALCDVFSKWRDFVISEPCYRVNVNQHKFRYTSIHRLPVKETWKSSIVCHNAHRPVLFVTERDRDNSWCNCTLGWTASTTEPKNCARHFC